MSGWQLDVHLLKILSHNERLQVTDIRWSCSGVLLLLTGALLFLKLHPLLQLLSDVSQRVPFAGEHSDCVAEVAGLGLPIKSREQVDPRHTRYSSNWRRMLTAIYASGIASSDWSLSALASSLAWNGTNDDTLEWQLRNILQVSLWFNIKVVLNVGFFRQRIRKSTK